MAVCRELVEQLRARNIPAVEVVVRSHGDDEAALLTQEQIGTVFIGEQELANGMTAHVLSRLKPAAKTH